MWKLYAMQGDKQMQWWLASTFQQAKAMAQSIMQVNRYEKVKFSSIKVERA